MKLVIQIPCLDEAEQLPGTLADLPRAVDGFDEVEWLVIDDGSTDGTAEVARRCGVDHIVRLPVHKGLAVGFQVGIDAALKLGADVIVNTDADNQYSAADIPTLVAPIIAGQADVVVGDRGVRRVEEFSAVKRSLQGVGSWVVSKAAGISVPDATSGFRAYSRDAALQLVVLNTFTYTLETLIQAGASPITVAHVPISRNHVDRPSRLFRSNWDYLRRSVQQILRLSAFYSPLRIFASAAVLLVVLGLVSWTPYAWDLVTDDGQGHLQSVVLGAVLVIAGVQVLAVGVLADMLAKQRHLTQLTLERVRRVELHVGVPPSHYEAGGASVDQRAASQAGNEA